MADYVIPLSYVVNATALTAQKGLLPLQLGTILILTDDEPVSPLTGDYFLARTASSVGQAFGTTSDTFKMANAIFAQNPNILNADGYVIVAPYKDNVVLTPATSGKLTTANISANLASIIAVDDGDLNLTIDGTSTEISGLDFTGVTTLDGVADVINNKLSTATVAAINNALVFTSLTTGTTSTVAVAASTGAGTDLYGASYLDGTNAVAQAGAAAVTGAETTDIAIARLATEVYTEGILTTRDLTDAEAIAASNVVEAMPNNIFFIASNDETTLQPGGLFDTLKDNKQTRKLLYLTGTDATTQKANGRLFAAAFASRGLSVNYNGSNSTITMTYKDLAGVPVDTNISETILALCEDVGADVYCSIEGLAKVISFKQGGQYFDELTNQIWLRTTIQTTVANVLFTTRNKVPQTTQGVNVLVNAIYTVLNQGVVNGMIGAGKWNSADTFGVYEDFMRGIRTFGYYVYFTPIAEQSQAEREARKCPVISVAVKLAGAIEHVNVMIYIEA